MEQLFRGEIELIFLGVDVGVLREREFHHGVVFLPAEEQADGGILLGQLDVANCPDAVWAINEEVNLADGVCGFPVSTNFADGVCEISTARFCQRR